MGSLSLALVEGRLRCGETLRYHTSLGGLIRRQDVAQHVYNLIWLATTFYRDEPPGALLLHLLGHDAGERFTGDIPGNFKRRLDAHSQGNIDNVEAELLRERVDYVPPPLSGFEAAVADFVDKLEGLLFCRRERLMGNKLVDPIFENYLAYTGNAFAKLARLHDDRPNFDLGAARAILAELREME